LLGWLVQVNLLKLVSMSFCPSVKSFSHFNEIWCVHVDRVFWFLLRRPCHLELTATTHDGHVNVTVLFSETVEDISVSLTLDLHCNLQFSVAASSRRICDVFSVNLRLQFPFNNNNNNRGWWVILDGMPNYPIQGQGHRGLKVAKMIDLLRWYAYNQKTNGELWCSETISKFWLDILLIFIVRWH